MEYKRDKYAKELQAWNNMIQRCTNEKMVGYEFNGAKGIAVCQRWLFSFDAFLEDMGTKPDNSFLRRHNTKGDYTPENTYWCMSKKPRKQNKKGAGRPTTVYITYKGRTQSIKEWVEETGIDGTVLLWRYNRGWPVAEALGFEPPPKRSGAYSGNVPIMTITAHGKTQNMKQWAEETGIGLHALYSRKLRGWTDEECIDVPEGVAIKKYRHGR